VTRAAGKHASRLDWARIERAALRRSGVPTLILLPPGRARPAVTRVRDARATHDTGSVPSGVRDPSAPSSGPTR